MQDLDFTKVYRPIQPAVSPFDSAVTYSELPPDPSLSNYIYCYWRLKSEKDLDVPFSYRVIPDGCIDIFINLNNVKDARIMGFSTSNVEFDLNKSFDYAGIRFMPGAFPLMFGIDASTLKDRDEDLFDVIPGVAKHLEQQLAGESDFMKVKIMLDDHFLQRLKSQNFTHDKRLYNAIHIVLQAHGNVTLKSDLDTGISPRQLRRLFEYYVGDTPKMFSKVVRFQYLFNLLSTNNNYAFNQIFLDAGYYDQPHFNKDFKAFFGLTPGEAFFR